MRRAAFAVVPVAAGAMLIPAFANAATTPTQMTGCLKKTTGALSLVKVGSRPVKACPSGTAKVTWNIRARGA